MAAKRVNPQSVKVHRDYTAGELAVRLGVHKNTITHWQREGLQANDKRRPLLFHGSIVRAFLTQRNAARKRPCPIGTLYCLRCREPRVPAGGMVDYVELRAGSGNLRAMCGECEAIMHRSARLASLSTIMPGLDVQIRQVVSQLNGRTAPPLNCDKERRDTP